MLRKIHVSEIRELVAKLAVESNIHLPPEILNSIQKSIQTEKSTLGKDVLGDLLKNTESAKNNNIPICQDTGMAVVFLEIGQDVHFVGGNLYAAVNEGIAEGYIQGLLRMSIVADPFQRENTNNNTPAIIHTSIINGSQVKITVLPKGFGSENMSRMKMFNPSDSQEKIIDFVVETVSKAGSNPCPPVIVGIGIGGTFEYAGFLAKKALCRNINERNKKKFYSDMEEEILNKINMLGIGPQGFGGTTTALAVNIEEYPTHIAGLPAAVNIGCHATRHKEKIL